jgi:hypothetical protein
MDLRRRHSRGSVQPPRQALGAESAAAARCVTGHARAAARETRLLLRLETAVGRVEGGRVLAGRVLHHRAELELGLRHARSQPLQPGVCVGVCVCVWRLREVTDTWGHARWTAPGVVGAGRRDGRGAPVSCRSRRICRASGRIYPWAVAAACPTSGRRSQAEPVAAHR